VKNGYVDTTKKTGMNGMAFLFSNPKLYRFTGKMGRWVMRFLPFMTNNKLNLWYKQREMPKPPKESFRDWYIKNEGKAK
jgi:L-lactate dehydrogenase complex protein LldF